MAGPWTTGDYEVLFHDDPPTQPHRPAGEGLARLAATLGRSTGAVAAQWDDARTAVLGGKTMASAQLVGYMRRRGWL